MKIVLASVLAFALLVQHQIQCAPVVVKNSPKSIPEDDFENFLEIQTALFRSNRLDQGVVDSTLQNHLELISNLNQAMSFLLGKIDFMQGQLDAMEVKVEQTDAKADNALEKSKSCITDVKFGPMQPSRTWHGPGYSDEKNFLITGVENHDVNDSINIAHRRRYQIYCNGAWRDAVWE